MFRMSRSTCRFSNESLRKVGEDVTMLSRSICPPRLVQCVAVAICLAVATGAHGSCANKAIRDGMIAYRDCDGEPVRWPADLCGNIVIAVCTLPAYLPAIPEGDPDAIVSNAQLGILAWNGITDCEFGVSASLTEVHEHVIEGDAVNAIYWVSSNWPYVGKSGVALCDGCDVPYLPDGPITGFDVLLNAADPLLEWSYSHSSPTTTLYVAGMVAHEIGHGAGLRHPTNTQCSDATMWDCSSTAPTHEMASLEYCDEEGMRFLYGVESLGCDCPPGRGRDEMSWGCLKSCYGGYDAQYPPEYAAFTMLGKNYIAWDDFGSRSRSGYAVFRSTNGGATFSELEASRPDPQSGFDNGFWDDAVDEATEYKYRIVSETQEGDIDLILPELTCSILSQATYETSAAPWPVLRCRVASAADHVYVLKLDGSTSSGEGTLVALDVSDMESPDVLSTLAFENHLPGTTMVAKEVLVRGGYLFACVRNCVIVFDISDDSAPIEVARITHDEWPPEPCGYGALTLSGDRLYVHGYGTGGEPDYLQVWDISDCVSPQHMATTSNWTASAMHADGTNLFTSDGVYDATSPSSLSLLSGFEDVPEFDGIIDYDGGFLYTTSCIIDVHDLTAPTVTDTFEYFLWDYNPGSDRYCSPRAARKGGHIYVHVSASGWKFVQGLDVSNPHATRVTGLVRTLGASSYMSVVASLDCIAMTEHQGSGGSPVISSTTICADVEGVAFDAVSSDGMVICRWRVRDPSAFSVFNLYRADDRNGPYESLNSPIIGTASQYTTDGGFNYEFVVDDVVRGESQTFRLEAYGSETATDLILIETATPYECKPHCRVMAPVEGLIVAASHGCDVLWHTTDDGPTLMAKLFYRLDSQGDFEFAKSMDDNGASHWSAYGIEGVHTCELMVEIIDEDGNSTTATSEEFVLYEPGHHCPYVCVWDGDKYVPDNSLLPRCELSPSPGIHSSYCEMTGFPSLQEDEYKLRIAAFEPEDVRLDQVTLWAVDHLPSEELVITDGGEFRVFSGSVSPLSCVDSASVDRMAEVLTSDDEVYHEAANDFLECEVHIPDSTDVFVVSHRASNKNPDGIATLVEMPARAPAQWDTVQATATHDSWTELGVDLSDHLSTCLDDSGRATVRLAWEGSRRVDQVRFFTSETETFDLSVCEVTVASAPNHGRIQSKILSADGQCLVLVPGEYLDISFSAPPQTTGTERSFVLETRGEYYVAARPDGDGGVAGEGSTDQGTWMLRGAYPNPSNPVTVIEFTAPSSGGESRVDIVSAAGRIVRTVFEGRANPGTNRVVWDGRDDEGESVASGVYFCRLRTADSEMRSKLVLVR